MWEFMKAEPIMFIVGGVILLLAIVGVIVGVVLKGRWEDRGLMERDGKKLRWGSVPVFVVFHPELSLQWQATFVGAAQRYKKSVGFDLFTAIQAPPGYNFDQPPPLGAGLIVICPKDSTGDMQSDSASFEPRYNKETGIIFGGTLTVPSPLQIRMPVMLHELGHGLGLAHDEQTSSIMYPNLSERVDPGTLSESDIDLLKKIYG